MKGKGSFIKRSIGKFTNKFLSNFFRILLACNVGTIAIVSIYLPRIGIESYFSLDAIQEYVEWMSMVSLVCIPVTVLLVIFEND